MAKNKIVFFDTEDYEKEKLQKFCNENSNCIFLNESLNDKTEITNEIKDADVISCFTFSRVTKDVLEKFTNLKLIALRSVGFNHIDIDYCKEHNIQVVNSAGYGNITVAEFAFGLILDVTRKISRAYMNLRNEHLKNDTYAGFELNGKNLGIVGTGAIGSELARMAKGFGMNVLAYDIYPKQNLIDDYGVKYLELDDLIKTSDIISLHAPLTKDNFHLINEERINMMKKTAVIINTARGELIDSKALYEALSENKIFGAGIDVLESENLLTKPEKIWDFDYLTDENIRHAMINDRLLKLHNVVVTPHIAYDSVEAQNRILEITINNINAFFNGKIEHSVIKR